jgi:hypothetical protein
MTDLNENYFKSDIKRSFAGNEDLSLQNQSSQLLRESDNHRKKSLYFSPRAAPSNIEVIETKVTQESNFLEIVEDDYMAKANTNNLLRPQFTTIGADEIEVENASGMGYEGPRMR